MFRAERIGLLVAPFLFCISFIAFFGEGAAAGGLGLLGVTGIVGGTYVASLLVVVTGGGFAFAFASLTIIEVVSEGVELKDDLESDGEGVLGQLQRNKESI